MAPISLKKGKIDEVTEELITSITGLERGTDNFNLSLEFALSNFRFHRFLDVNSFDVKRRLNGLAEKFAIHCQHEKAEKLNELREKYLSSRFSASIFLDNTEEHYGVLSILLELSDTPTYREFLPAKKKTAAPESDINWTEYLLEGEEKLENGIYISDDQLAALEESDEDEECLQGLYNNMFVEKFVPNDAIVSSITESSFEPDEHQNDLSWLQENIISQYWKEHSTSLPQLESGYECNEDDTVNLCQETFQANMSFRSWPINQLTEKLIVRETLWMLQGVENTFVYLFTSKQYHVRKNIVMGHTSQDSLQNILEAFASTGTKLQALKQFVAETCNISKSNLRTLRAFAFSISSFLKNVKKELSEIETEVMKEAKVFTCLTLMQAVKELSNNCSQVFELFSACVTNANEAMTSPGEYMANIINTLYEAVCRLDEHASSGTNQLIVILPIFLETLRPFLTDLGNWISFGKLPRVSSGEFFIEKNSDAARHDSDTWYNTYRITAWNNDGQRKTVPKFLVGDVEKILLAGKSRGLLEAAMQNSAENESVPFDEEFFCKFLENLGISLKNNETTTEEIFTTERATETRDVLLVKTQYSYLLIENFRRVFQTVYARIQKTRSEPVATNSNTSACLQDALLRNSSQFIEDSASRLPIKLIFDNTLRDLVEVRYKEASKLLLEMLKVRYNLDYHISVMKNFFLMEAGDVMNMFYSEIFTKIRNREIWQNTSYLTSVLHEALMLRFPKLVKTLTAGVKAADTRKFAKKCDDIQSIDTIILRYQLEWPLTIIFDNKVEEKYNAVFGFLLQTKRALWSLEQLHVTDFSHEEATKTEPLSGLRQKLYILRARLLHFVQSFHVYIMTRILHSSGLEFKERLKCARDFEEILSVHKDFLEKVCDRCLLTPKVGFAKEAITRILSLCLSFQNQWDKGLNGIVEDDVNAIETEFDKCSHFIQSFLNSLIKRGSFPHLELLSLSLKS